MEANRKLQKLSVSFVKRAEKEADISLPLKVPDVPENSSSLKTVLFHFSTGHAIAEGAFIALMHDFRIMRSDRGWITWPEVHLKLPMTNAMLDLIR